MNAFSCSEDSYDAIYKCSCLKMLCMKHYFSHQENFPSHEINRIKIDINNKSRQILINFIITYKQKLISILNNGVLESIANKGEEYQYWLYWVNVWFHRLNLLLLFLSKAKYVEKKTFYTPFEYFLHQPEEKASKYVNDFKFPGKIQEVGKFACRMNIFYYNYLKFEDKRYIFGYNYIQVFDQDNIFIVCFNIICKLFSISEYEMSYEALQNLINIAQIADENIANFWDQLVKILYDFIINKDKNILVEQWTNIDESLPKNHWRDFYGFSQCFFKSLNRKDLVLGFIEKEEIMLQNYDNYDVLVFYNLANSFYENQNYEKSKIYYEKFIQLYKKSSDYNILWNVIDSCDKLFEYYSKNEDQRKVKEIVNIVNKIVESYGNTGALDEVLLLFYISIKKLDNACKLAWKLIRLYEKNHTNGLCLNKSHIYLYLGMIYIEKHDLKKFLLAIANAKSCCGILPMNDELFFSITYQLGWFLLSNDNIMMH